MGKYLVFIEWKKEERFEQMEVEAACCADAFEAAADQLVEQGTGFDITGVVPL
jgi:hypothetical protein